ncbi:hypothetical protein F5Y05DRAFT_415635 [Hypoxylon sp. FL0543]|nr:hypothetical protein F5Y05DRAFT_415635 [Hypoxylon sp. FL0543]
MDGSASSSGGMLSTPSLSPMSSTTGSEPSTRKITMSLVVVEVTSPETIVVAPESESPQPTEPVPVLVCEGPHLTVRKGQKFDIIIDVESDEGGEEHDAATSQDYHIQPVAELDISYENAETLSAEVLAISNSPVNITLTSGRTYGLSEIDGDILDLSRVELFEVALHDPGHYFLHLVIEAMEIENGEEVTKVLAQIITRKVQVSE